MDNRDESEERTVADSGSSEQTTAVRRPRNRWLLFFGVAVGMAVIGCFWALLSGWPEQGGRPWVEAPGRPEGNRPVVRTAASPGEPASAAQEQIFSLKQEAFDVASQVVEDFPDIPDALCVMALVHNRYGNRAEAVEYWRRCLELDPTFVTAYYCLGWDATDRGEYEEGSEFLRKAIEFDPDMADAHLLLARTMMDLGSMQDAIIALEEHIRVSPRSAEGYFRLGQAYLLLEQYEQAKQYYKVAVEIDPALTRAYYGLTTACARLGEAEEASKYREKFLELKTDDQKAKDDRRRGYDDLAAMRQSVAYAHLDAGKVYRGQGDMEKAEEHWLKAAELNPEDTESRKLLVSAYEQANMIKEAIPFLEQLSQIEPENVTHHMNLGVLNLRAEQFEAAEQAFRKVTELAPERPEGYAALAQLYVQTDRDPAEAQEFAKNAVRWGPIAAHYFLLSTACDKNGDYPGALTAIQVAMELDPGSSLYREMYEQIQKKNAQGEKQVQQEEEQQEESK